MTRSGAPFGFLRISDHHHMTDQRELVEAGSGPPLIHVNISAGEMLNKLLRSYLCVQLPVHGYLLGSAIATELSGPIHPSSPHSAKTQQSHKLRTEQGIYFRLEYDSHTIYQTRWPKRLRLARGCPGPFTSFNPNRHQNASPAMPGHSKSNTTPNTRRPRLDDWTESHNPIPANHGYRVYS